MAKENSFNSLSNAFRSFFGNISLQEFRKNMCQLIDSLFQEKEQEQEQEQDTIPVYLNPLNKNTDDLIDYINYKAMHTCYFGNGYDNEMAIIEDTIYTNNQQPKIVNSKERTDGFLKQMKNEFKKYKWLLRKEFQLHNKTLRDEFESYKPNLTTSVPRKIRCPCVKCPFL